MEIIGPEHAQQALARVRGGEEPDLVWNTTPHQKLHWPEMEEFETTWKQPALDRDTLEGILDSERDTAELQADDLEETEREHIEAEAEL